MPTQPVPADTVAVALTGDVPTAASDQYDVQAFEVELLALARVNHPRVTWWQGYRPTGKRYGSFCYVCDIVIATWSGNSGPTKAARAEINSHKLTHRDGKVPPRKTTTRKRHTV